MSEESKQISEPPASAGDAAAGAASSPAASAETSKKGKGKASKGDSGESLALNKNMIEALLKNNPALAAETEGKGTKEVEEFLKGLKIADWMTGMVGALFI